MAVSPFLAILRNQDPRAFFQISGDWKVLLRLHFLHAAQESGLLGALSEPRTREDLSALLEVARPELLDAILELGSSLGEISEKSGRYRVTGSRSRALQAERNDALAALVEANVTYYNGVFRDFSRRLKGAPLDERIRSVGPLVARVSRISEPFVEHFLREVVRERRPRRILDIGCGSGQNLRTVLEEDPRTEGVGLEVDPEVVTQARENLRAWGLGARVAVISGDVRAIPGEVQGPFDLILLFSVIYYFSVTERIALLQALRNRLSSGGALVIATSCRGASADLFSANLNLATSSMEGLTPLPGVRELEAHLREGGFDSVLRKRLIARTNYFGFIAS